MTTIREQVEAHAEKNRRELSEGVARTLWRGANLREANLYEANLRGANLYGANLYEANLPTGEKWESYLAEVAPALLTAGGRPLAEVATKEHWECHSWDNCPMAAAFGAGSIGDVPALLRPRAEQFIQLFDAGLVPLEAIGEPKPQEGSE